MADPGQIVILNGAPRSGKSSIAVVLLGAGDHRIGPGVDADMARTPADQLPGIGLRPGGERPDLEPIVVRRYAELFDEVAALSRAGDGVVVDVGLHDDYSRPLGILADCAESLAGLPLLLVGVRCPLDEIMRRRDTSGGAYLGSEDDLVPAPVARWQRAVHDPGIYDLDVDTSRSSPDECAQAIENRLHDGPPGAALWKAAAHVR